MGCIYHKRMFTKHRQNTDIQGMCPAVTPLSDQRANDPMSAMLQTSFECVQNANARINKLLTGDRGMGILFRTGIK